MQERMVRQVRSFNRAVAQRIGVLNEKFLGQGRPVGQARLLWEIGPDGSDVRELRNRLELDSGYLSRLLRSLQADGLVDVAPSATDARVRTVRLTEAGRAERDILDRRSDELAVALLAPLPPRQRERLVTAMAETERLLAAARVRIEARDPRDEQARVCLRAYFEELGNRLDGGFDPARSISANPEELTEPAGLLLVASSPTGPVGCGALKFHGGGPAEVKRMWVSAAARGTGLGRRILGELETRARERGVRTLRLETNRSLVAAIALYRSAGYEEVPAFNDEPYAHRWFEKHLEG
jgi:DNA-binding MarR family transcriptional regulator